MNHVSGDHLSGLRMAVLALPPLLAAMVYGAPQGGKFEYKQAGTTLEGYLACDRTNPEPRPGILIFHDWMGVGPYVQGRADQLAAMGYVVLAADVYGKGMRPADAREAAAMSGSYRANRPLMRARARAALDALRADKLVDPSRIVAMGYCFGGGVALELARDGADIAGVMSFHGAIGIPDSAVVTPIKPKILVMQGADDPVAPIKQIGAFEDEMRKAKADYQIILYGNTVHSFTIPTAGSDPSTGSAYNQDSDRRSWEAMKQFLAELFP